MLADFAPGKYEYQPLEHLDSFRLLKLHPSTDPKSDLRGEIVSSRLSESSNFDVLEVVETEGDCVATLQTPSGQLHVRECIDAALRKFRLKSVTRPLWVEAICVDQSSESESREREGLSEKLYAAATRVHYFDAEERP
jgi:hypothetical protein